MKAPRSSDGAVSLAAAVSRSVQTVPFRIALALLVLAAHLTAVVASGKRRFGAPFNAAPDRAPALLTPHDHAAANWNRLSVSRWDSGNYISIALGGYRQCPDRSLRGADLRPILRTCILTFYPTYPLLGWLASMGGRVAIDYALWGLSLLASALLLFLWTGPTLAERLGLWPTYVSFAVFNVFPTGFILVTTQTEPLALLFTLGAFIALARRHTMFGAALAGTATAMRVTAMATGLAYAAALIALTLVERPREVRARLRRGAELVLSGWGILALAGYYWVRFGDPLIYARAHAQSFKHEASLAMTVAPGAEKIALSLSHPLHEGVWLAAALLWFGLGHKPALAQFARAERVFLYALFATVVGIAAYGSAGLAFAGMNRYLLLCVPLFFAIAALTARKPFVLVLWLALSSWHYWNADLCEYSGGPGDRTLRQCHQAQWVGRI
jgi:hypothetical protein